MRPLEAFAKHGDEVLSPIEAAFEDYGDVGDAVFGDLSVISWARHIMRCKSHGYANEEEKANCSASGSGPRAAA